MSSPKGLIPKKELKQLVESYRREIKFLKSLTPKKLAKLAKTMPEWAARLRATKKIFRIK
jgi:hypothetical protein